MTNLSTLVRRLGGALSLAMVLSGAIALAAPVLSAQGAGKESAKGNGNGNGSGNGKTKSSSDAKPRSPRPSKEFRAALKDAAGVAGKAKGLKGKPRSEALAAAARAYEQVACRFAGEAEAAAGAWFKAGESWRKAGDLDAAATAYARAAEQQRYQERGWLELAHIERRRKQMDKALSLYQQVARLKSGTSRTHEARMWIGRCFEAQQKVDKAADTYRQALSVTTEPKQVVEACDRLALLLVKMGKLDQAAATIRQAETAATPAIVANKKGAKGLKKALDGMSARKALERARDKATGAHRDAQALERK